MLEEDRPARTMALIDTTSTEPLQFEDLDLDDATPPEISVIIPIRNCEQYLEGLLESLEKQTLIPDRFEVLVVDDGSIDSTGEVLARWCAARPRSRRLLHGPRRGPAAARNVGIAAARGRWVAFTDGDTLPDPTWLEAALDAVKAYNVTALEGSVEPWPREAISTYTHQVSTETPGRFMTANMIYERALLNRLSGFDERFSQAFLEDSDLAFRALDEGITIPFAPEVRVLHRVIPVAPGSTLRSARKHQWFALLAAKHPERYRQQLRGDVRPLTKVDVDAIYGTAAIVALPRSSGWLRVLLGLVSANALRRAFISGRIVTGSRRDAPARAFLAFALPLARAWWWLVGCLRYRKIVW